MMRWRRPDVSENDPCLSMHFKSCQPVRMSYTSVCTITLQAKPTMPDRAGYQVSLYAIDVSSSMGEVIDDPTGSTSSKSKKTKLDYVKEFVARKCEPKACH
jgi:hypothetical protein